MPRDHVGVLEADRIYDQYVKPLEKRHRGSYVAVSSTGEILLGETLHEVASQAAKVFGPKNFLFKVGERVVGTWR